MSAQTLLTYLAESILFGSIALYTALFLEGLLARHRSVLGQLEIDFSAAQPEPEPEPIAPVPPAPKFEIVILPFRRPTRQQEPEQPQAIALSGYSIRQLKAIASRAKLPKYNTCTKAELQARLLAEVPADRLSAALAEVAAAA